MTENAFQTPDPKALIRVLLARWPLMILPLLIGAAVGWQTTPKPAGVRASLQYEATAIMVTTGATEPLERLKLLTTVGEVPKRVAKDLGRDRPEDLVAMVALSIDKTVGALQMTATSHDKTEAAAVANAFAKGLIDHLNRERQAAHQRQIDEATKDIQTLATEIRTLDGQVTGATTAANELLRAQRDAKVRRYSLMYEQVQQLQRTPPPTAGLTVLQEATSVPIETATQRPQDPKKKAGMFGGAGLLAGLGLALGLEQFNRRVRSREDARSAFGYPVLTEVSRPRSRRRLLPASTDTLSRPAAAYRFLLGALAVSPNGSASLGRRSRSAYAPVVLVTSPGDREGNTVVTANLAATLMQAGLRTIVVSADLRHSKLHRILRTPEHPGFLDVVEGRCASVVDALHESRVEGLSVLPSGGRAANPAAVLAGEETRRLIAALQQACDIVVIDTTPLMTANDAAVLLKHVDYVVVVARAGRTTMAAASAAGEFLRQSRARVAGVVLFGSQGLGGTAAAGSFPAFEPLPPPQHENGTRARPRAPKDQPVHEEDPL